ncbi:MAG TPA: MFS transporter [Bradyrhizobium sp.]|nr:MFS transporter [Bradyrhizobium sp.]
MGGIIMARVADRVGTRWTVIFGPLMIGLGLSISTFGPPWPLWIGHGLFIGLIGIGGINAPMYIYVSRWFDRRRGSALALISSGTYPAGGDLAAGIRASDRQFRLAAGDAVVCSRRDSCRRAAWTSFLKSKPKVEAIKKLRGIGRQHWGQCNVLLSPSICSSCAVTCHSSFSQLRQGCRPTGQGQANRRSPILSVG